MSHCSDGSDEATELCGANCEKVDRRFACSDGQCVEERYKCNGVKWRSHWDAGKDGCKVELL